MTRIYQALNIIQMNGGGCNLFLFTNQLEGDSRYGNEEKYPLWNV